MLQSTLEKIYVIFSQWNLQVTFLSLLYIVKREIRFCSYGSDTKVLQNFNTDVTTMYQYLKEQTC